MNKSLILDECSDGALNDCDPNALCLNLMPPENFQCTCNAGYTGDGTTCLITDECTDNTHNCDPDATCNKDVALTGFSCTCNSGFVDRVDADGITLSAGSPGLSCEDTGKCRSH